MGQYHYLHFKEIDSTNDYLKNGYPLLNDFTFVSADYQSKGKGRNNRSWNSELGKNLMFSLLIKEKELMAISPLLGIFTAVEVSKVLEDYQLKNVSIKWPNDVLVNDKKICGILLEGQVPEYVVVGVGLNVNQKGFPSDLRRPATSLINELGKEIDIEEIKTALFNNIAQHYRSLAKDDYLTYFRNHNYLLNKRVKVMVNEQLFIGEVVGIDNDFFLQIKTSDMLLHIDSGEIEIL